MHTWKKKLVVSQLALACTLAITSQANASTYDTFGYVDTTESIYSDSDYLTYGGYVYNTSATDSGYYDTVFSGDTVNGVISTYYLNYDDYVAGTANTVSLNNSTVHGMITSKQVPGFGDAATAHDWIDGDIFTLNINHSNIDDDYEGFYFTDTYLDADGKTVKSDNYEYSVANLGTAVTLDVESNINISNNSRVAGITLEQNDTTNIAYTTGATQWDNNITVNDSTVTSGSWNEEEQQGGHFGNSVEPSDYGSTTGIYTHSNDNALEFDDGVSDYRMVNNVTFNNSQLMGDVYFSSTWNVDFDPDGHPTTTDSNIYTHGGWADDDQNVDHLTLTLNNSKWVGGAWIDYEQISPYSFYDVAANSLDPDATHYDNWGRVDSAASFQSGVFDVVLNNGSEWDVAKESRIDTLTADNSKVDVANGVALTSDTIALNNASALNIGEDGQVSTDHLTINSFSTVTLADDVASDWSNNALNANTITVTNGGVLDVQTSNTDAASVFTTDTLELTSGNYVDNGNRVVSGVFDINSNDYILNADLVNDRTWDTTQANYGYGTIAMNSDGHLTVNGNGDINNVDTTTTNQSGEADNSSVDNVAAATGNYKVRIDNATGAGSVADYKGKELIYVNDVNTTATFSAANKADLGAYTYQAQQQGNTVVLQQMELTDYANMALSIPSANTNIWNLEQDTVGTRLTNARHGLVDNGGAWVSYFGGSFDADNGTINYDQDVNGIMVGVDSKIDGNNAKWIVGAAAGFAKGDMSDRTGQVDQDSQTAYIYSSAHFANNIFVDGNLSYSHFNNDLSANMSNGQYVDGSTSADAWGFGLKLGYDLKLGDAGYVTPYGSVSGLFQSGDDYKLSNDMKVDGQSYDSMRYELGVDAGYTFAYSDDQALTPYFKLAYVYDDSNNDADVNGDSIDNGVEGSAVRVGLGTQFSFTKNFSAYTDANYLGGGDVDQDWSANVGVKYTW
ncbi:autotransporter outer membrane beta-barrel domain-containing protein [Citrobacter sp. SX206]|uniref:autotransporter outer membrane beta-barrel domain-containing protein n=1 Tax=Citrobacter TaxID=544 RepID=UPI000C77CD32|nr:MULTISPECIES: autotransporter outer membrane beta-barrel domain-containing protein [Citrobacter]MBJ8399325.1 autotransporter outer membrane beta-barrel domain-containing protein [Citrobacter youngae]MBJ9601554.1 autotransporter outer membrane beta-barrel domain-containing protein [Citrobacter sp. FDAARGOS_156]NTX84447.1 autotransporter outer membrane beta-barrel domain-containing protein [Citrobacter youngae]RPH24868.1 autotransporter outer membrane beta-barrel domain-containing protein [Cit